MIPLTQQPLLHHSNELQAGKDPESQTLCFLYGIALMPPHGQSAFPGWQQPGPGWENSPGW